MKLESFVLKTKSGIPLDAYYEKKAMQSMTSLSKQMNEYAKQISPTDTGEYISNRKDEWAKKVWGKVEATISNATEYAWILETGVRGRAYNYHKWPPRKSSTRIYSGVGNRTAQRTLDFIQKDFIQKINTL